MNLPIILKIISPTLLAYLDPGTGSFIYQLLIAGLMGGLFLLKLYWKRIKIFIARILGRSFDDTEVKEGSTNDGIE